MGEEVRIVRGAAYRVKAILSERHVQTLASDGQTLVDTTALYMDVSMRDLADAGLRGLEHGDKVMIGNEDMVVVGVMDRLGFQRARLHHQNQDARAW